MYLQTKKRILDINGRRMNSIFNGVKHRCNNPSNQSYHIYGGRGIKCEWNNLEEFYRDMFPTYIDGYSLDRIDNNGNYSKENCQWLTRSENSRKGNKNYVPEENYYVCVKRDPSPLDILFENSGLNIKGYCGTKKKFKDDITILDGIEIHTYYSTDSRFYS